MSTLSDGLKNTLDSIGRTTENAEELKTLLEKTRTIAAGTNVTVTDNGETVTINATGGGSSFDMNNNQFLTGETTGNVPRNLIGIDGSDILQAGNAATPSVFRGSSANLFAQTAVALTSLSNEIYLQGGGSSPKLIIQDADYSAAVELTIPNIVTSYTITLPAAQGAAGETLQNDGAGNLSWAPAGAPSGNANTLAYYDGSGNLASNNNFKLNTTTGGISFGDESTGSISASDNGALASGLITTGGTITASDRGAMARGSVDEGSILASSSGSLAQGRAISLSGAIEATQIGAIASGYVEDSGQLLSQGSGSLALGFVNGLSSAINAQEAGAIAAGRSLTGFQLLAAGFGSLALGEASTGEAKADGTGSIILTNTRGDVGGDSSMGIGEGINNNAYASLALGRYNIPAGTPNSWVATEHALVIGNGTGVGAEADAFKVDKDGRVTQTASVRNTAVRLATGNVTVDARTDYTIIIDDATAGAKTIQLPPAEDGLEFRFCVTTAAQATGGDYTFLPDGTDTVDIGVLSLIGNYESITLVALGTVWYKVNSN